jgi:hypothetical protein
LQRGEFAVACASGHQAVFPSDLARHAKYPAEPSALLFD